MIRLRGVRERNLADLDLELPADRLVAFAGPSGSGKSTLLFDVVHAESRRRLLGALGELRPGGGGLRPPALREASGLPPTVAVRGRSGAAGPRSTVATGAALAGPLRQLFAALGEAHCPSCEAALPFGPAPRHVERALATLQGERLVVLAPPAPGEAPAEALLRWRQLGYVRCHVGGEVRPLEESRPAPDLLLVVDRLRVREGTRARLLEALEAAHALSGGRALLLQVDTGRLRPASRRPWCAGCGTVLPEPTPGLFSSASVEGACPACEGRGQGCAACGGSGLRAEAGAWRLGGHPLRAWWASRVEEAAGLAERLRSRAAEDRAAAELPLGQLRAGLEALRRLGLGYLALGRPFDSLSSGERRRVRLAARLAVPMAGVLYLLDEPFEGLHPADLGGLLQVLEALRAQGAGVWVAGHEAELLRRAELIVELGPGAGAEGGRLVALGPPSSLVEARAGTVGPWLDEGLPLPARRRLDPSGWLRLRGARRHNLRGVDLAVPLGALTALVGPSGSGKSTVLDLLQEVVERPEEAPCEGVEGADALGGALRLQAEPPRGSRRSVVATFVGAFDAVRFHFAALPEARVRGWKAGRFSFNAPGGRCERCRGEGSVPVEAAWLQEERLPCPACGGRRFEETTLQVRWRGLSVADVLALRVEEALALFEAVPKVARPLRALQRVGLGHLPLGRDLGSLSAGEGQRLRLAELLARARRAPTLLLLDEPGAGLHPNDVDRLLLVLDELLTEGHTVVLADHRLRLAAVADHVVELGPGGGPHGGRVLAAGPPERVARGTGPSAPWLAALLRGAAQPAAASP